MARPLTSSVDVLLFLRQLEWTPRHMTTCRWRANWRNKCLNLRKEQSWQILFPVSIASVRPDHPQQVLFRIVVIFQFALVGMM